MGSDSGRQLGARSPSTLRIPPAPGSPSNAPNPALPRVGCHGLSSPGAEVSWRGRGEEVRL